MLERAIRTAIRTAANGPTAVAEHADVPSPAPAERPLFLRNSYALILNTGITGVLGLGYWVLAAHYYEDSDVGHGSAAISALMLLTGMVSANFAGTLNRFIPNLGRRTGAFLAVVYAVTCTTTALFAVVLLVTLHKWGGPTYDILRDPHARLWFVVAAAGASVVTVQDGILTGLRAAVWVPVWNTAFAISKLALLVVLAQTMPRTGVFYSWIIPMIVMLFPVNLLVFVRLVPRHARIAARNVGPTVGQICRFFAGDYLGALMLYGIVFLVPILVAAHVSPHTYAYFYLAWAVATMMNLVAVNMATSMAVEGVCAPTKLSEYCRAALQRVLALLVVGVVGIGLAAPYAARLIGPGYLDAVPLLQLLVFASLPSAVVDIAVGTLRAQSQPRRIVAVQAIRATAVLGFVLLLLNHPQVFHGFGDPTLTAVGAALLLGQLTAMLAVLPHLLHLLRPTEPDASLLAGRDETL